MKAIITAPKNSTNILIVSKNNPDSAAIMVRNDETVNMSDQGWFRIEKRVGLIKGSTNDLTALIQAKGLKAGDDYSEKVSPIKFVIKEQTTPFYEGQEPKINPSTGAVVTHGEEDIYRYTFVVPEGMAVADVLLENDRVPSAVEAIEEEATVFSKQPKV